MFPIEAFRPTLEKIRSILEELHIRYHLTGGVTSISYGEPRMTQDIDIVVENSSIAKSFDDFLIALNAYNFMFEAKEIRTAIQNGRLFQLLDLDEVLKLDIYPRELVPGELDRARKRLILPGLELPLVSLADAAVSKLVWISHGSHKGRRDLRKIYRNAQESERTLIEELSTELNLTKLLREVLAEPDELHH